MSRTMKLDSTESYRVIVTREAIGNIIPETYETLGPFGNLGTAKTAVKRATTTINGEPRVRRSAQIQRTTTDWQDVA